MTKEKYMALADFQTLWTNTIKPYIVAGFIAITAVAEGATPKLVLQNGSLIEQSTFQPAGSYVLASEKGANSGVATLDANGLVPSSQLPSFVDDVIELKTMAAAAPATCAKGDLYYNTDSKKIFEATATDTWSSTGTDPEGGKIYINLADMKEYRWGGTAMAEISASVALGETAGTAYEGSKGAQLASDLSTHTGNSDIHVTTQNKSDWNAKYDKPSGGIPSTDMTEAVQTSLGKADTALQSVKTINGASIVGEGDVTLPAELDANPMALTAEQIAALRVNDVVNKTDGNGKYAYTVVYKNDTLHEIALRYVDVHTIEEIYYEQDGSGNWKSALKETVNIDSLSTIANSAIKTVKVNGTALTPDSSQAVDVEIPERVTSSDLSGFVI